MVLVTDHFKRHGHTDEHRMYIYDGDLRHAHTAKTTTNKPMTITYYWVVLGFTNVYAHVNLGHHSSPVFVILAWECFCLLSAQCVIFVCNEGNVV